MNCPICNHPIVAISDHTPEKHESVGITDRLIAMSEDDIEDAAEDLATEFVEALIEKYGPAVSRRILRSARQEMQSLEADWIDTLEMTL